MRRNPISTSSVLKHALLHALIILLLLNILDIINFLAKTEAGMILRLPDGSALTVWDRIVHNIVRPVWIQIVLGALVIEANYHFVFRKKKSLTFILTSAGCGFISALLFWAPNLGQDHPAFRENTIWLAFTGFLSFFTILFLYTILYAIIRDYIEARIYRAEKQLRHSQAELAALKAQINPHFFFNTLNSIYGTAMEENAERTARLVEQLSGLMRYVVSGTQSNAIPASAEIRFVEQYLELQRIRIPDEENIKITQHVAYDGKPANIAPLLLIPFIENAFQYGVSIDHACDINVSLTIKEQRLKLLVVNRILPGRPAKNGLGTGIRNARRQLELLYPNRHQLEVTERERKFMVSMAIDLNKQRE